MREPGGERTVSQGAAPESVTSLCSHPGPGEMEVKPNLGTTRNLQSGGPGSRLLSCTKVEGKGLY